jgi:uncharacterized protein YndB with AHSA1/START domain
LHSSLWFFIGYWILKTGLHFYAGPFCFSENPKRLMMNCIRLSILIGNLDDPKGSFMDSEKEIKQIAQNFAKAEMLIRKPVKEVFESIINPEITTNFWFTKSSGRLDKNRKVEWEWEMYNHRVPVFVKSIQPPEKIIIDWGNDGQLTTVEWFFKTINERETFLSIIQTGFKGSPDKLIAQVRDSTEGFAIVLAGMKAWLEYGIRLNLVADRFPR